MSGIHRLIAVGALVLALLAPGPPGRSAPGTVVVANLSPFPADCGNPVGGGRLYHHSAVEPYLVVDPRDPNHLVGIWQQDRWLDRGANAVRVGVSRDGGVSWTLVSPALTLCAGGGFDRVSDPWLAFAPSGDLYLGAILLDRGSDRRVIGVARSGDGGLTWSAPEFPLAMEGARVRAPGGDRSVRTGPLVAVALGGATGALYLA